MSLQLEDVNYIEHYGLQRTISEAGRYHLFSPPPPPWISYQLHHKSGSDSSAFLLFFAPWRTSISCFAVQMWCGPKQSHMACRWEKVSVHHSWNANWLFTNSVTFSLQRHSDHHAHAHKPYHRLQDIKAAPQLPASYPVIMLLAFLPGLFFDVMDPRALAVARLDQDSD